MSAARRDAGRAIATGKERWLGTTTIVIASAATQSIEQQERKLDCFAALAMTTSELTRRANQSRRLATACPAPFAKIF
jgi:hypothetical protein